MTVTSYVSGCGKVCHGVGKRNLGWTFEEMKGNTLLIDVKEGNCLQLLFCFFFMVTISI